MSFLISVRADGNAQIVPNAINVNSTTVKSTSSSFYVTSKNTHTYDVEYNFNAETITAGNSYTINWVWGDNSVKNVRPLYCLSKNSDGVPDANEVVGEYFIPSAGSSSLRVKYGCAYCDTKTCLYVMSDDSIVSKTITSTGPLIKTFGNSKVVYASDTSCLDYGSMQYNTGGKVRKITDKNIKYLVIPSDGTTSLYFTNNTTDKYIYFTNAGVLVEPGSSAYIYSNTTNTKLDTTYEVHAYSSFYFTADAGSTGPRKLSDQYSLTGYATVNGKNIDYTVTTDGNNYKLTGYDYTATVPKTFTFTNKVSNYYKYNVETRNTAISDVVYTTSEALPQTTNFTTGRDLFGPAVRNRYLADSVDKSLTKYGTLTSCATKGNSINITTNEATDGTYSGSAWYSIYSTHTDLTKPNQVWFTYKMWGGDDKWFQHIVNDTTYLHVHPKGFSYSAWGIQLGDKVSTTIDATHTSQILARKINMYDCNCSFTINFKTIDIDGTSSNGSASEIKLQLKTSTYSNFAAYTTSTVTIPANTTSYTFKLVKGVYFEITLKTIDSTNYCFNNNNTMQTAAYNLFTGLVSGDISKECKVYYNWKNFKIKTYLIDGVGKSALHTTEKIVVTYTLDGASKSVTLTSSDSLPYTIKATRSSTLSAVCTITTTTTYPKVHFVNSENSSLGISTTIGKSSNFDLYEISHDNVVTDNNWLININAPYNITTLFNDVNRWFFFTATGSNSPSHTSITSLSNKVLKFNGVYLEKNFNTTNRIKPAVGVNSVIQIQYNNNTEESKSAWDTLINNYGYHLAFTQDDTSWRKDTSWIILPVICKLISPNTYMTLATYDMLNGSTITPTYGWYSGVTWGNTSTNIYNFIQPCITADATNISSFDITFHDALVVNRTTEGDKTITAGTKGKWYVPKHKTTITIKNVSDKGKKFIARFSGTTETVYCGAGETRTWDFEETSYVVFDEETVTDTYVNKNGTWKPVEKIYVNKNGTWVLIENL